MRAFAGLVQVRVHALQTVRGLRNDQVCSVQIPEANDQILQGCANVVSRYRQAAQGLLDRLHVGRGSSRQQADRSIRKLLVDKVQRSDLILEGLRFLSVFLLGFLKVVKAHPGRSKVLDELRVGNIRERRTQGRTDLVDIPPCGRQGLLGAGDLLDHPFV